MKTLNYQITSTSLDFEDDMSSLEVEKTIARLENKIKNKFTNVKRIYVEAQSSIEKD
jgi:divalent metal cation (Fe/Co/Zn/Cd) transporter